MGFMFAKDIEMYSGELIAEHYEFIKRNIHYTQFYEISRRVKNYFPGIVVIGGKLLGKIM